MKKHEKEQIFIYLFVASLILSFIFLIAWIINLSFMLIVISTILFVVSIIFIIIWSIKVKSIKEELDKIRRQETENKKHIAEKQIPNVQALYDYCLEYTPNIDNLNYKSYTESINEKFCVEKWNYYSNENRFVTLDSFQITKRCDFSIWYSKIQSMNIDIFTAIDEHIQSCEIVFYIFYEGNVYYDNIDSCKWEEACARISFDYEHLDDAKRFCEILKTIIALKKRDYD